MAEFVIAPLTDVAGFLSAWSSLASTAKDASFFQSPAWMTAWLDGAPNRAMLHQIEGRDGGQVKLLAAVTLAPRWGAAIGLREVWFQEFGDKTRDAIYAEYLDFLTAPDAPSDIKMGAVNALIEQFPNADGFVFRNARAALRGAALSAAAARGFSVRILQEQPVYGCNLKGDPFIDGLSASLRSRIRRSMRLYEERGPLRAKAAQSPEERAAAWAMLQRLHQEGWKMRGGGGVFANVHLTAFHERLQAAAPEAVDLFEVTAGDETIAVLYIFLHGRTALAYQSGFKYEDDNRLAPGFVAHALAAQYYQDKGFEMYDLLAGEAEYKARLAGVTATLTSLVVERDSWRNRARALLRR